MSMGLRLAALRATGAPLSDSSPIEFNVSGFEEKYLDVAKTQPFVKAKTTKANGAAIEGETKVGPVNLFLHCVLHTFFVVLC